MGWDGRFGGVSMDGWLLFLRICLVLSCLVLGKRMGDKVDVGGLLLVL